MRDDQTYNLPELGSRYAALVEVLRRNGSEVITAMIAPIGENMTLGDEFYDVSRISAINVVIERISTEKRVPLIRFDTLPKNSRGALQDNLTVDGVHLTNRGYEAWGTLLHPNVIIEYSHHSWPVSPYILVDLRLSRVSAAQDR